LREFSARTALASALAAAVRDALQARLARDGKAALAVSGGTTPVAFFQHLAREKLDWARVTITLVDDRCVPESSDRSNVRLVKEHLLQHSAKAATFLPLLAGQDEKIAPLLPFAAVVLGMGADGHTASLFPGGDHLAAALAGPHLIETMRAPGAPEPRVTLTLPALLQTELLALHIEGAAKRVVLATAEAAGPVAEMPIRAVLAHRPRATIFWCP
jgi:6-phosphogluconolactonase